jgi:hypothetical protein
VTSTGGSTGPRKDEGGVALAKPGDSATASRAYLNLGDIRLINNRWGADALNCGDQAKYKIYVNSDGSAGYDFDRPTCDHNPTAQQKAHPDYPEFEFGVAPFGKGSSDLTSPAFSSTTLLPKQIKDITSASVTMDGFNSTYSKPGYYDTNFEFWISKENPLTSASPGVYAEVIVFLGWDNVRMNSTGGWPCDSTLGFSVNATATYDLCHQKDGWGSGGWRFFNFTNHSGSQNSWSGKGDIKTIIDKIMSSKFGGGFTTDMWLTRIEVGTEVDDNTAGTAKVNKLTFEINGTSKSIELAQ